MSKTSIFHIPLKEAKSHIHFCCTIWVVEKMIKLLLCYCFVEIFHWVMENFLSGPFDFKIHLQLLTWTQLFCEIRIIYFVHDFVRMKICCLDRKAMMSAFMLLWSVKSSTLLITKFTFERNDRFWGVVFFNKMITQVHLGIREELGPLVTIQGSSISARIVQNSAL